MSDVMTFVSGCTPLFPGIPTQYGYRPSLAAGVVFCSIFGLSFVLHVAQMIWKRRWWTICFAIGAFTELLGWSARSWSATCPYNNDAFLMQISTLILAPTFFLTGIYIILGRFIRIKGRRTSPISPLAYLLIFATCDAISLIVQAVGGGIASSAEQDLLQGNGDPMPGTNTMVAGIIFQMASLAVFVGLFMEFLRRAELRSFTREQKYMVAATTFSVALILARSVYRTIELLQGWFGFLINHEDYFIALDGALMVCAVGVFNFAHPAWLLYDEKDAPTGKRNKKKLPVDDEKDVASQQHDGEGEVAGIITAAEIGNGRNIALDGASRFQWNNEQQSSSVQSPRAAYGDGHIKNQDLLRSQRLTEEEEILHFPLYLR